MRESDYTIAYVRDVGETVEFWGAGIQFKEALR